MLAAYQKLSQRAQHTCIWASVWEAVASGLLASLSICSLSPCTNFSSFPTCAAFSACRCRCTRMNHNVAVTCQLAAKNASKSNWNRRYRPNASQPSLVASRTGRSSSANHLWQCRRHGWRVAPVCQVGAVLRVLKCKVQVAAAAPGARRGVLAGGSALRGLAHLMADQAVHLAAVAGCTPDLGKGHRGCTGRQTASQLTLKDIFRALQRVQHSLPHSAQSRWTATLAACINLTTILFKYGSRNS